MARILVIDDDDDVRVMLRHMLERAGHEVVDTGDAREGVKLYRELPTDVVITDLLMPDQDGIETILQLRAEFPGVKIIAISGGGRSEPTLYLQTAQQLGAVVSIAKPFVQADVLGAISKIVDT